MVGSNDQLHTKTLVDFLSHFPGDVDFFSYTSELPLCVGCLLLLDQRFTMTRRKVSCGNVPSLFNNGWKLYLDISPVL